MSYQNSSPIKICVQANDSNAVGYIWEIYGSLGTFDYGPFSGDNFTVPNSLPYGTFGWHVRSIASDGSLSAWSDTWNFTLTNPNLTITSFSFDQGSPSNAELVNIYACPSYLVSVTLRALVNTASDGSANGNWVVMPGEHGPCNGTPPQAPPIPWDTLPFADGTHLVRIEARDNDWNPAWSQFSSADQTFTLSHRRPDSPSLIQPAQDSWWNTRDLTFAWSAATNANSYYLCVSTDPTLSTCDQVDQTLDSSTTSYSASMSGDWKDVYWNVTAINDVGSNVSNTGHFGIDITPPYSAMAALLPIQSQTAFPYLLGWQRRPFRSRQL